MPPARSSRREYIDWLRGVAVVFMIGWHTIDAWTLPSARDPGAFAVIVFFAGWAAPLFLFLAGVSLPLAGAARLARGGDRASASWALQKRGWQIFLLAHVFRFQSFLLNPNAQWNGLLKPDILNILGLAVVAVSFCWGRVRPGTAWRWFVVPACAAVVLTPLAAEWWWPTLLHPRLEAYVRPVGNNGVFSLLPAVGYVFAGAYLGSLIAADDDRPAFHRRLVASGIALVLAGWALAIVPPFRTIDAGLAVASVVLMRVGTMSAALGASWALLRWHRPFTWSPLLVFGRTSLFVYWVHVELAYGLFTRPIHRSLSLPAAIAGYVALTAFMYACAWMWLKKPAGPLVPPHMAGGSPVPLRVQV